MANYIGQKVDEEAVAILKKMAQLVLARLKRQVPVDTGKLKRSLTYSITKKAGGYRLYFGYIYYGMFVDLGVNGKKQNFNSPFSFKKRKFGIRPRHWTDIGNTEEELEQMVAKGFGKSFDEVMDDVATRSQAMAKKLGGGRR